MKRRSDEEISAPLYAFDAEVRSQYAVSYTHLTLPTKA